MVGNMAGGDLRLSLVVLAPLIGSILSYLLGRRVPKLAGVVASGAVLVSFVATVLLWREVSPTTAFTSSLSSWLTVSFQGAPFSLPIDLYFDSLSAVMCLIVTGVGFLIHLYSAGYMAHDKGIARFFAYLNLFIAAMLILVLGKSLPVIFIGWEGVGLCSYLLIGFWYTNTEYAKAGRKAFVMNRIGDVGFIVAMALLFTYCGTLDVVELSKESVLARVPAGLAFLVGISLFVAATGKSAQIPLFTWLPDAMAGPTPVSALIHAATMVTAGIYLMGRMHGVVELDPAVPAVILWVALATAAVAATTALAQNDIKKVLAYSTVSQLGFMFLAVGVGQYAVALCHVVTHAFFKACLFLSAGSVIHECHHEQDMRRMGGLAKKMPITAACYGVSTLAIAGICPFAGYYSKHAIFGAISTTTNPFLHPYIGLVGGLATAIAVCTAFYMARSFIMTFLGSYRGEGHPHEAPVVMTAPVAILGVLAVVGGFLFVHPITDFVTGPLPPTSVGHESGGLFGIFIGSLPGIFGIALAAYLFILAPREKDLLRAIFSPLERLFERKYYADELLDIAVVRPVDKLSGVTYRAIDQRIVEGSGGAVGSVVQAMGELTCRMTTGQVTTYVLLMFFAAAALFSVFSQVR